MLNKPRRTATTENPTVDASLTDLLTGALTGALIGAVTGVAVTGGRGHVNVALHDVLAISRSN
jgi:outer membrane lipoprotein SlyB